VQVKNLMPDMIILDLARSKAAGLETCRILRNHGHFKTLPIIVSTPSNSPEYRAQIYDAGATDIFPVPVSEKEVQNRVHMYLNYRKAMTGLQQYHARMARELKLARAMQDALLPPLSQLEQIAKSHQLAFACRSESSEEMGGDFWGIDVLDADRLFIYITDFSGHGLSASLNTFRLHSLISHDQITARETMTSPADYLEKLNRDLFNLLPTEQYATMLCGIIDLKKNVFTYAAAASTAPVKMTIGVRATQSLDPSGFPLGMIEEARYDVRQVPFKKGEILFFYSDVLTESQDHQGRMIGEEKFLELCQAANMRPDNAQNVTGQVFLDGFMEDFNSRVPRPLLDDLTAVTVTRL